MDSKEGILMNCASTYCDPPQAALDDCLCSYCEAHCDTFCRSARCDCKRWQVHSSRSMRWNRLGLNYPDAEHGGRTGLPDFLDALEAIDARLEKYEPAKKGEWRGQSLNEHVDHAMEHLCAGVVQYAGKLQSHATQDLTAAALRALMALQIHLAAKPPGSR